jgi:hypothetical protein
VPGQVRLHVGKVAHAHVEFEGHPVERGMKVQSRSEKDPPGGRVHDSKDARLSWAFLVRPACQGAFLPAGLGSIRAADGSALLLVGAVKLTIGRCREAHLYQRGAGASSPGVARSQPR